METRSKGGKGVSLGLFILVFLMLMPVICQADIIKIGFTGVVDSVDDSYNLLENGVQDGASISGFYIYDSETPDSESSGNIGFYQHSISPYGMLLTIGDLTFQTDWTNVDFSIGILDNYFPHYDQYSVISRNNILLDNGVIIESIGLGLDDPLSGTAISSDVLPLTALDLAKWTSKSLWVDGSMNPNTCDLKFNINGCVTDIWLIPEPSTMLLLSLGGVLLKRRS